MGKETKFLLDVMKSGVYIISANNGRKMNATTVSLCIPVSFSPPCIAVSLDNKRYIKEMILETGIFAVMVLSGDQTESAGKFGEKSGRYDDKFKEFTDFKMVDNLPIINGCSAWMICKAAGQLPVGDHIVIAGEIVDYKFYNKDVLDFNADRLL